MILRETSVHLKCWHTVAKRVWTTAELATSAYKHQVP